MENNLEESNRIIKNTQTVSILTFLSRILGAGRDLVIANIFGAGWVTDAFVQAFTIPNILRRLTAEGAMTLAFIPIYTEIRERKNREEAKKFAAKILGLVIALTFILSGIGIIFSPQLVYILSAGFATNPEKFELTVFLTRIMFPYLILVSLVSWSSGVLNAERRFGVSAASPIFLNIGIIISAIIISPLLNEPIIGIGIGVLLGGISQIIFQIPSLIKIGYFFYPRNFFNDPNVKKLLSLLGPSLLGLAVYQINIIVLRNLASFMPSGQVTYYYNASRLSEFTLGIFAFAITTASFPELSNHMAKANWEKIRNTLNFTVSTTLLIIFPASFGLAIAAEPIVSMLYFHGAYSWEDVEITALALQAFALSIPAVAIIRLQTVLFFTLKDTKTPVKVSLISIIVTGLLGWWLSQSLEIVGLALGLTLGTWIQLFLLTIFLLNNSELRKKWWPWRSSLIYLASSGVMTLFVSYIIDFGLWEDGPFIFYNWLIFLGLIIGAVIFYAVLLFILRDEQFGKILIQMKSKLKK